MFAFIIPNVIAVQEMVTKVKADANMILHCLHTNTNSDNLNYSKNYNYFITIFMDNSPEILEFNICFYFVRSHIREYNFDMAVNLGFIFIN
jgi:hypothetical protein